MKIPEITDERLEALSQKIRPLVRSRGELWHIKPRHPQAAAFSPSPVLTEMATGIEQITKISTLHSFGYSGRFEPSVAEVLAQIPEEWIERTVAFSVLGPHDFSDRDFYIDAINAGIHVAETTLYGSIVSDTQESTPSPQQLQAEINRLRKVLHGIANSAPFESMSAEREPKLTNWIIDTCHNARVGAYPQS